MGTAQTQTPMFKVNISTHSEWLATQTVEQLVVEGRTTITPAVAARILNERVYARQRPLNTAAVSLWEHMLKSGEFSRDHQLWFGRVDGVLHLIDGQHRLSAVVHSGVAAMFMVMILDVASEEDLHEAYSCFDRAGRPRSLAEVVRAKGLVETHQVSATGAKALFVASLILHYKFDPPHHVVDPVGTRNDQLRLQYAEPWWSTLAAYEALLKDARVSLRRRLMSPQVLAVALITMRDRPEEAGLFWGGMARNDGLRRGDPRNTLAGWLTDVKISPRQMGNGWTGMIASIAAVTAWNAFYEHRNLDALKLSQIKHFRIAGTAFSKSVASPERAS